MALNGRSLEKVSHVRVEQCVVLLELCVPRAVPSLLACFFPLVRDPGVEKVGHRDRPFVQGVHATSTRTVVRRVL